VTVKNALAISSIGISLASMSRRNNSCVAEQIASRVLAVAVVAPRTPLDLIPLLLQSSLAATAGFRDQQKSRGQ
jgi:hypothetical protein